MLETDRYAGKKRKKPVQKQKPAFDVTKTNPSKRHRDRLNGELDRLTNMLPFPEDVRSRLDKLSVLRLSVGYLKVKSFFNATMKKNRLEASRNGLEINELDVVDLSEGDLLLQALNGFVLVVTAEGYVFYASPTIQDYLGFHQSDMVHQSVFEFIHIDDRAMFRRQLHFALNSDVDQEDDGMQNSSDITRNIVTYDPQHIPPENSSFLERSFVCRFRCLLDNSSGFLKLNFQGRLKFLHGQNKKAENGCVVQPQLALFAVATPVQPPAILEIRMKTLIFQTKHKLDFTPLGIDPRGKIVLGYSEMELCMRGSGYQFIHAADMMHCADNHVRMIKTGESGMTVFRLLTKNGRWIWVQANARLVYKDGRPDFIIARQRALENAEGEKHLRQRRLQLPFSLTTGEAMLYETSPTLDIMSPDNNNKELSVQNETDQKPLDPSSILASMQRQDKSIYQKPTEPEFTVDDAFMDSWALFNVPSHISQDETVKVEEDMIDTLEKLVQDGDLCTALQQMDVDNTELKKWENTLLRMAKESSGSDKNLSLDEILTNDIFSYVEDVLNEEISKGPLPGPNGLTGTKASSLDFEQCPTHTTVNSECGFFSGYNSVVNTTENSHGLIIPGHQKNISPQIIQNNFPSSEQTGLFVFGSNNSELITQTQKQVGQRTTPRTFRIVPSTGWEPQQNVQNDKDKVKVHRSAMSAHQFGSCPLNQTGSQQIHHLPNGFNQLSQPPVNHWNKMDLGTCNHSPPLSSERSPFCPNVLKFHQQRQMQPTKQWQQTIPEQPSPGLVRNGLSPEIYQNLERPGFPLVDHLAETSPGSRDECNNTINNAYHSQRDTPAANYSSSLSSCMFESYSPLRANAEQLHPQAQALTVSSCTKNTIPNNQSPPQASCYFQWTSNKPVVGTSSIPQEDACISPSGHMPPGITPTNDQNIYGQYRGCNGQTEIESRPIEYSSSLSVSPLVNGIYLPENSKANCCNL